MLARHQFALALTLTNIANRIFWYYNLLHTNSIEQPNRLLLLDSVIIHGPERQVARPSLKSSTPAGVYDELGTD
jgi:hypothetical protein